MAIKIPRITIELTWGELAGFAKSLMEKKSEAEGKDIIARFETEFATRYGLSRGVALPKARMAFYYLLKNMGLKPGGEVLISAIHVGDFANMILLAGFNPVVVDLERDSFSISLFDLERKLNPNSVLILITHLYGYATDMDRIRALSEKVGVPFIEDCSQAVNAFFKGKRLGTFGKAAIFSLSLIKPVCTMFGGVLVSADRNLLEAVRKDLQGLPEQPKLPLFMEMAKHCVIKTAVAQPLFSLLVFPAIRLTMPAGDFFGRYQRHNKTVSIRSSMPQEFLVRFSWQQAQLGLCQLAILDKRGTQKSASGKKLYALLKNEAFSGLPRGVEESGNSFWLFPVATGNPEKFKRELAKRGLDGAKILLSVFSEEEAFASFKFSAPNAELLKKNTVFIPLDPSFSDDEIARICNVVNASHRASGG